MAVDLSFEFFFQRGAICFVRFSLLKVVDGFFC